VDMKGTGAWKENVVNWFVFPTRHYAGGLIKAAEYFSHDTWSPERGLRPEPPAEKQKFYPFDRRVSLRMRKT